MPKIKLLMTTKIFGLFFVLFSTVLLLLACDSSPPAGDGDEGSGPSCEDRNTCLLVDKIYANSGETFVLRFNKEITVSPSATLADFKVAAIQATGAVGTITGASGSFKTLTESDYNNAIQNKLVEVIGYFTHGKSLYLTLKTGDPNLANLNTVGYYRVYKFPQGIITEKNGTKANIATTFNVISKLVGAGEFTYGGDTFIERHVGTRNNYPSLLFAIVKKGSTNIYLTFDEVITPHATHIKDPGNFEIWHGPNAAGKSNNSVVAAATNGNGQATASEMTGLGFPSILEKYTIKVDVINTFSSDEVQLAFIEVKLKRIHMVKDVLNNDSTLDDTTSYYIR